MAAALAAEARAARQSVQEQRPAVPRPAVPVPAHETLARARAQAHHAQVFSQRIADARHAAIQRFSYAQETSAVLAHLRACWQALIAVKVDTPLAAQARALAVTCAHIARLQQHAQSLPVSALKDRYTVERARVIRELTTQWKSSILVTADVITVQKKAPEVLLCLKAMDAHHDAVTEIARSVWSLIEEWWSRRGSASSLIVEERENNGAFSLHVRMNGAPSARELLWVPYARLLLRVVSFLVQRVSPPAMPLAPLLGSAISPFLSAFPQFIAQTLPRTWEAVVAQNEALDVAITRFVRGLAELQVSDGALRVLRTVVATLPRLYTKSRTILWESSLGEYSNDNTEVEELLAHGETCVVPTIYRALREVFAELAREVRSLPPLHTIDLLAFAHACVVRTCAHSMAQLAQHHKALRPNALFYAAAQYLAETTPAVLGPSVAFCSQLAARSWASHLSEVDGEVKSILFPAFVSATSAPNAGTRIPKAVQQVSHTLHGICRAWAPLPPTSRVRSIHCIFERLFDWLVERVLALEDIGADECEPLADAVEKLLALELTLTRGQIEPSSASTRPALCDIARILRLPLADIVHLWNDGELHTLPRLRLLKLITALFEDSSYRAQQLSTLSAN